MWITAATTLISAVAFGTVDFLGGIASRKDSPLLVTAGSHLVSALFIAVAVLFWRPERMLAGAELGWALTGGLASGFGVLSLYAGFSRGKMGLVSAVAAAISGGLPAVFDLLRGTSIGSVTLVGLALAVVAAVLVSISEDSEVTRADTRAAVAFAIVAGTCFALGILAFDALALAGQGQAGAVGSLPLVFARLFSAAVLSGVALVSMRRAFVSREAAVGTSSAGFFDAVANVALYEAIVRGPLVLVSPLQALYPIPTIVLAWAFLKERVRGLQMVGMALALVALMLTTIPT